MTTNGATLRHWWAGLFLLVVALTACNRRPESSGTVLFPTSKEAAEWTRTSDIRMFPAADLWKYTDGEAERYLSAGVQTTSTADYRFRGKYDAVVDIYQMAGPAGVERIFASEPAAGGEAVQIGDGARLYQQSLIFREGSYLVRITAYDASPEVKSALLALGRAVEAKVRVNP